jgi:hypothetical protein
MMSSKRVGSAAAGESDAAAELAGCDGVVTGAATASAAASAPGAVAAGAVAASSAAAVRQSMRAASMSRPVETRSVSRCCDARIRGAAASKRLTHASRAPRRMLLRQLVCEIRLLRYERSVHVASACRR